MEVWILIGGVPLIGIVGYIIVNIQDWIDDVRFYNRRTQKELERAKRTSTFDKQKVLTITGTVGYEQLEVMGARLSEAEKLIKEAKEKKI
jgi:hypothetical protein